MVRYEEYERKKMHEEIHEANDLMERVENSNVGSERKFNEIGHGNGIDSLTERVIVISTNEQNRR